MHTHTQSPKQRALKGGEVRDQPQHSWRSSAGAYRNRSWSEHWDTGSAGGPLHTVWNRIPPRPSKAAIQHLSPQPRDHPGLTAGVCSALTDWRINKTLGTLFTMVVFLFTVTVLYSFRKGHLFIYCNINSTNAFHAIHCYCQALGAKLEAQACTLLYSNTGSSSNYWYHFS